MVKGVAKYAVVVKGTGVDGFSDAIFISDGRLSAENGIRSEQELLLAARRIAGESKARPRKKILPFAAAFAAGCFFAAALLLLLYVLKT